jgi:TetR/AcrR family transcriptional regulator, ethionamide resistance regulator
MPTSTRSRRAGPTKGDLKEQAILETAERLFAERPVAEISVDELARGAGISRPSFYFYFGSKEDVLLTVAERVARELEEEVAARLAGITDDPRSAISAAIEAVAEQWRKRGPLLRAAIEAWGSVPPVRETWEKVMAGFVAGSTAIVEHERGRGAAGPGPEARALVTALTWMNERCFYTTFAGLEPSLGREELVNTLTEVWMRAIYGRGDADRRL